MAEGIVDKGVLEQNFARAAAVDDEAAGEDQQSDGEPAGNEIGAGRRLFAEHADHEDGHGAERYNDLGQDRRVDRQRLHGPVLYLGAGAGAAGGAGFTAGAAAGAAAGRTDAS